MRLWLLCHRWISLDWDRRLVDESLNATAKLILANGDGFVTITMKQRLDKKLSSSKQHKRINSLKLSRDPFRPNNAHMTLCICTFGVGDVVRLFTPVSSNILHKTKDMDKAKKPQSREPSEHTDARIMNIKGKINPENMAAYIACLKECKVQCAKAGDFPSGVPDSQEQPEPQPKRKKQSK